MNAIAKLAEEIRQITKEGDKRSRTNRQRFVESEIVELRPDYIEATEILDALRVGLALKMAPDGDALDADLEHAFKRLREELDLSDELYLRRTYDPRDQYYGPEDDFPNELK